MALDCGYSGSESRYVLGTLQQELTQISNHFSNVVKESTPTPWRVRATNPDKKDTGQRRAVVDYIKELIRVGNEHKLTFANEVREGVTRLGTPQG